MIKNLISLIKQFRRLVFFRHTSLAAQSASVTYYIIRSFASFATASSDEKILRLDSLRSNLQI